MKCNVRAIDKMGNWADVMGFLLMFELFLILAWVILGVAIGTDPSGSPSGEGHG